MFQKHKSGIYCLSFDSVSMSGIIVETLKIAGLFFKKNFNVFLDLGYEIKADKNKFFIPYQNESQLFPEWLQLIKTIDKPFYSYSVEMIRNLFKKVVSDQKLSPETQSLIETYSNYIAAKIIALWTDLHIKFVFIENGTLPENIIVTKALYKAIEFYGQSNQLGKYVLWRDHDLMWSSEDNINKYGNFPYINTPKLSTSRFITHVVLHSADREAANQWCPEASIKILRNDFQVQNLNNQKNIQKLFRRTYNVPSTAVLFARFTRIIPQKRIDRDLYLIFFLNFVVQNKENLNQPFFLGIAGDTTEHPEEYSRLKNLIARLNIEEYVFFTGNLTPIDSLNLMSLKNLILASDACLFLPSFDYDSFGNPISEAISFCKPYITSTYHRYQHVYGDLGYQGILFPITKNDEEQIEESFARKIFKLFNEPNSLHLKNMVSHNCDLMQHLNLNKPNLESTLQTLLTIT